MNYCLQTTYKGHPVNITEATPRCHIEFDPDAIAAHRFALRTIEGAHERKQYFWLLTDAVTAYNDYLG